MYELLLPYHLLATETKPRTTWPHDIYSARFLAIFPQGPDSTSVLHGSPTAWVMRRWRPLVEVHCDFEGNKARSRSIRQLAIRSSAYDSAVQLDSWETRYVPGLLLWDISTSALLTFWTYWFFMGGGTEVYHRFGFTPDLYSLHINSPHKTF